MSIAAADPAAAVSGVAGRDRAGERWLPPVRRRQGRSARSAASSFMLVVNFFLFRVLPGDPARTLGRGRLSTAEQIEEFNETYGLDQSALRAVLHVPEEHRSPATSATPILYRGPVSEVLADRLWPTLLLVGTSTLLAALIGVWMGVRGGWERGGRFDQASTGSSLTLYSMPEWWLGLVLIAVFAVGPGPLPGLFPTGGLHSADVEPGLARGRARHRLAPHAAGDHADPRLPRRLRADHARVPDRRDRVGLPDHRPRQGTARHRRAQPARRPNALLPTTTVVALNFGFVVGGAITIETIFSIPGLGLLTTRRCGCRTSGCSRASSCCPSAGVIVANLAANLLYGWLDPRVRA